jgi:hypothetical protein
VRSVVLVLELTKLTGAGYCFGLPGGFSYGFFLSSIFFSSSFTAAYCFFRFIIIITATAAITPKITMTISAIHPLLNFLERCFGGGFGGLGSGLQERSSF